MSPAPYIHAPITVGSIMRRVVYALVPGTLLSACYFGIGVIVNCTLAVVFALLFEALILKLRRQDIARTLKDGSAVVTAILFSLVLSPYTVWWVTLVGIAFAIIVAKHLYGGIGRNPFNPAMAACVFVLLCFPEETVFQAGADGTGTSDPVYGLPGSMGREWIAIAWLTGGVWLMMHKIIRWQTPAAVLSSFSITSLCFYVINPDSYFSPVHHLFGTGVIFCAFFIATDPSSSPATPSGKILYGAGIGFLIYLIRTWGNYPDSIAFPVLFMNALAPLFDYYTRPAAPGKKS